MKFLTRVWNWVTSPFIIRSLNGTPFTVVRDRPVVADSVFGEGFPNESFAKLRAQVKAKNMEVKPVDFQWLNPDNAGGYIKCTKTKVDGVQLHIMRDPYKPLIHSETFIGPLTPESVLYEDEAQKAEEVMGYKPPTEDPHV